MISCTVEKRHTLPGFHFEWNSHKLPDQSTNSRKEQRQLDVAKKDNSEELPAEEFSAGINKEPEMEFKNEFQLYSRILTNSLVSVNQDSCDILVTRNGDFIYAKAVQEDGEIIRFTSCNDVSGARRIIAKEALFMIKYHDGSKSVMENSVLGKKEKNQVERVGQLNGRDWFRSIDEVSLLGFVFGLGSLPTWFFYWQIGFFMSIFAILMGIAGIIRIVKSNGSRTGLGFAIASLVLGVALFITSVVVWLPAFA